LQQARKSCHVQKIIGAVVKANWQERGFLLLDSKHLLLNHLPGSEHDSEHHKLGHQYGIQIAKHDSELSAEL
jgi:hypothetical protein